MNLEHPFIKELQEKGISVETLTEISLMSKTELDQWIQVIDESSYPLGEWAEALSHFEKWSKNQNRKLSATHQLEYISCCAESSRAGVKLPLSFLLQEFLKTNGVESSQ